MRQDQDIEAFKKSVAKADLITLRVKISGIKDDDEQREEKETILIERAMGLVNGITDLLFLTASTKLKSMTHLAVQLYAENGKINDPREISLLMDRIKGSEFGGMEAEVALRKQAKLMSTFDEKMPTEKIGHLSSLLSVLNGRDEQELGGNLLSAIGSRINTAQELVDFVNDHVTSASFHNLALTHFALREKIKTTADAALILNAVFDGGHSTGNVITAIKAKSLQAVKNDITADLDTIIDLFQSLPTEEYDDDNELEQIVVASAVIQTDSLDKALKVCDAIKTKPETNRFIAGFANRYSFTSRDEVEKILNKVEGVVYGNKNGSLAAINAIAQTASKSGFTFSTTAFVKKAKRTELEWLVRRATALDIAKQASENNGQADPRQALANALRSLATNFGEKIINEMTLDEWAKAAGFKTKKAEPIEEVYKPTYSADELDRHIQSQIKNGKIGEMFLSIGGVPYTFKTLLEHHRDKMPADHVAVFEKYVEVQEAALAKIMQ